MWPFIVCYFSRNLGIDGGVLLLDGVFPGNKRATGKSAPQRERRNLTTRLLPSRQYLIDFLLAGTRQRVACRVVAIWDSIKKFWSLFRGVLGIFWFPSGKYFSETLWNNPMLIAGDVKNVATQWLHLRRTKGNPRMQHDHKNASTIF